MKEFRRPSGQGAGRGGFDKREQRPPSSGYGTHRGDRNAGEYNGGERREMKFQATCSECNKTCEVPFRPNGSKPVYCKDCFGAKKGAHSHGGNDTAPKFEKRDFGGHAHGARDERPQQAPQRDSRIDELKSQVDSMQSKLDRILRTLEGNKTVAEQRHFEKPAAMAKVAEKLAVMPKPAAPVAPVKKAATVKAVKKTAPAKKAAAKPASKPVAKKKK